MRYTEEIAWVFNLKSAIDIKVFAYLLGLAKDDCKVTITRNDRTKAIKFIKISNQQFTNSLNRLKKLKLIGGTRGRYTILF